MASFTISINDRSVTKTLNTLSKGIKDYRVPLNKSGEKLQEFYGNTNFKTQGRSLNQPWKPLAEATLRMRRERRGHYANNPLLTTKVLIWTGALKAGFRKKVARTKMIISNNVDYFKFNQLGSGGKPPKRIMLAINSKVVKIVNIEFTKYLVSLLK